MINHLHIIWAVKNRQCLLRSPDLRQYLWTFIEQHCRRRNLQIDVVGGYDDHVHCLLMLRESDSLSHIIQIIKSDSAHWLNANNLCATPFAWQEHYFFQFVHPDKVGELRQHILRQEKHHQTKSLKDEYEELIYGSPKKRRDKTSHRRTTQLPRTSHPSPMFNVDVRVTV